MTRNRSQNIRTHGGSQRQKRKRRRGLVLLVLLMIIVTGGIGLGTMHYYTANSYLILKGDQTITVGLNGVYEDPGVTAKRGGRDVSDKVEVDSRVDVTTPGEYELNYRSGNFTVSRKVIVLDHMVPDLDLKGKRTIQLKLGDKYKDPGYSAKAEDGTDLTDRVEVSQKKFNRAGTYNITYSVSDDEGHTTRMSRRVKIEPNTDYDSVGLPICMYHYVYDEEDPPDDVNNRYQNYISKQDLIEEMDWLNDEGYYYPSWDEVRDFVDGKLLLPDKSIVLTFDDGEYATLDQLIPITNQTHVPVTSFLITEHAGETKVKKYKGDYFQFQSHTHKMHHAGGSAQYRGMLPVVSVEAGVADLKESIEIIGSNQAMAYPYGDFNDATHLMLEETGFLVGVTTQFGKAYPGMDPLTLPRVRMWQDQSLARFQEVVGPPTSSGN